KMRRRLRRILRMAGAVREYDLLMGYLSRLKFPEAKLLNRRIQACKCEAENKLLPVLQKWVTGRTSLKWRTVLSSARSNTGFDESPHGPMRRLAKMASAILERGNRVTRTVASPQDVHRLRIAMKEFRYRLELLASAYDPPASEWLDR